MKVYLNQNNTANHPYELQLHSGSVCPLSTKPKYMLTEYKICSNYRITEK